MSQSRQKLNKMTLSLAYKAIRNQKMKNKYKKGRRTEINMQKTKTDVKNMLGIEPSEEKLWRAIRNKDISRQARYFLSMTFHDAYMVGSNWQRPGYANEFQERSECKSCHVIESMEHITNGTGQKEIWKLTEEMWVKRNTHWYKPTIGIILASANMKQEDEKQKRENRRYKIVSDNNDRISPPDLEDKV
jgi:hypothetical protein